MAQGTVKQYFEDKGFGFIQPDDGGEDLFVHESEIYRAGLRMLREGERVIYEVQMGPRGRMAHTVHVVEEGDEQGESRPAVAARMEGMIISFSGSTGLLLPRGSVPIPFTLDMKWLTDFDPERWQLGAKVMLGFDRQYVANEMHTVISARFF
jgi:CspA family cold shock protein